MVSENRTLQDGGGITNEGTLALVDSTVTENTAPFGAGLSSLGTTEIVGSTNSNNTSTELTSLRPDGRDCGRRGGIEPSTSCV